MKCESLSVHNRSHKSENASFHYERSRFGRFIAVAVTEFIPFLFDHSLTIDVRYVGEQRCDFRRHSSHGKNIERGISTCKCKLRLFVSSLYFFVCGSFNGRENRFTEIEKNIFI